MRTVYFPTVATSVVNNNVNHQVIYSRKRAKEVPIRTKDSQVWRHNVTGPELVVRHPLNTGEWVTKEERDQIIIEAEEKETVRFTSRKGHIIVHNPVHGQVGFLEEGGRLGRRQQIFLSGAWTAIRSGKGEY